MCDQPQERQAVPCYQQRVEDVVAGLGSDAGRGLSAAEAQRRLVQHGRNELAGDPPVPSWRRLLAQFSDMLVILLIGAGMVSAALWIVQPDSTLPYEAMAILAIVILNAILSHLQQSRAEQAVEALRRMTAAEAGVIRDGARRSIPAAELVPGDIILIEEGDNIPADARVISATALQTAEAALTGESLPVLKGPDPLPADAPLGDRANMVFNGTSVTRGHGRAVVTETGMRTEMGRIADLLRTGREDRTPLQDQLDRAGRQLAIIVVGIAAVTTGTILLFQDVQTLAGFLDVLILGVALAVAAVPEGLPTVVTMVLSRGVQRMAGRRAIVRHLAAVETLGSATVVCTDKTGTLTRNEMTVRAVVTASGRAEFVGTGYAPEGAVARAGGGAVDTALRAELMCALTIAERASNAVLQQAGGRWTVQGDPTEGALIVAARKAGLAGHALEARFRRIAEVPFSSERKLMSTVEADSAHGQRRMVMTKGAPDVLLARCSREMVGGEARTLTDARRAEIRRRNEALAAEALRTLGVACRVLRDADDAPRMGGEIEQELVFAGLIGMIDPPRAEAAEAVALARGAGIRPVMMTGDHPTTAAVIARELGIAQDGRVVTGAELEQTSDPALDRIVRDVSVYARVNPEHKLRIVTALQRCGDVVAMTGDGVNDAPALSSADIGVAMGITGTDVSKEAADIVLADDNFATIVAAIGIGRSVYANIRQFLRYLLSSNIGEVATMFLGVLLADMIGLGAASDGGLALPLLATHILWINLVTDGAPALALGIEPPDPAVMDRPPRPRGEPVITRRMWGSIVLGGAVMAVGTLLVLDASLPGGMLEGTGTLAHARTMAFTTLVLFQLFNALNARSETRSAFRGIFHNRWLWPAIALSLALHLCVIHLPLLQQAFSTTALSLADWLRCALVASSVLWVRELTKAVARARRGKGAG